MWRNKNVWIVLTGEFVVGLGLWAGIIGNLAFMTELIPSDFHKSLLLAVGMLAGIAVGPLAGRIIDSRSKKIVLLGSSIGRIVAVIFMFVAIYLDSIWFMLIFLVFLQIAASFFMPAMQSVVPMIVKDKDLLELNGWQMNIRTASRIVGAALAGIMVASFDVLWLYVVSIIMYIAMYFIMTMLTIEEGIIEKKEHSKTKDRGSFKEVLPVLVQYPIVLVTLVLIIIPILFLGSFNLVVMSISELHNSSSISGIIYTVEGIGFMLGAFLIKKIGQRFKTGAILFTTVLLMGIFQSTLYFADIQILAVATFGFYGFVIGLFFPTTMTIFQRQVPKEFHGRFFSFRTMIDQASMQIVLLSTGALLDLVGLQFMGLMFGLFSLTITISFIIYLKSKKMKLAFA
jgi:MFS transporter, DHA3 family, macrolide efflux protein